MTTKHTPGPWFQGCGDDPKSGDIYMSDSSLIAEAFINGDIETMLANARLIAAAPDLLDVLQEIVHLANEIHDHWDNDRDMKVGKYLLALSGNLRGYDKRTDELHDTIAKAIGGESCQQPS